MDSQRFVKILQETVRSQNEIMYALNAYIWEAEKSYTPSISLSSLHILQEENQKLREEIAVLKAKLFRFSLS